MGEIKQQRIIGDPNGTPKQKARWQKCQRSKHRNEARKALRLSNVKYIGRQLHCWPLPEEPRAHVLAMVQAAREKVA
jgi:hypothetical protein